MQQRSRTASKRPLAGDRPSQSWYVRTNGSFRGRPGFAVSLSRFDLKYSNGPMPHEQMLRSIELIGTRVAPRVQELLGAES
jgi:hypothetical protein